MNKVKPKAIEVTLSDGQVVVIHSPKTGDMGTFLRAMPALQKLAKVFQVMQDRDNGIVGQSVPITDDDLEPIYPLFAIMTDITEEEFKDLPLQDGMGCLQGLTLFSPNSKAVAPVTEVQPTP